MDIAVIIPLFNGERWIHATLRSVYQQTRPPREVIVVNDGSTDGSVAIVRKFPGVRLVDNPEKGANVARRHGLSLSNCPLVALLDQDDLWHPRHLALLADWLEQREPCRAIAATECGLSAQNPDPKWDLRDARRARLNCWRQFPFGPMVGTPSAVLMRRSALDAIGGWPVEFPGMADYFVWLGLSAARRGEGGMALSHACTLARRRHGSSYSSALRTGPALTNYADSLCRASQAAAERFEAPLPPDVLARRVTMSASLHVLTAAVPSGDWTQFSAQAHALWAALSHEPPALRKKFGAMVTWMLDGRRPLPEALYVFARAIEAWPAEDLFTRAILHRRRETYRLGKQA